MSSSKLTMHNSSSGRDRQHCGALLLPVVLLVLGGCSMQPWVDYRDRALLARPEMQFSGEPRSALPGWSERTHERPFSTPTVFAYRQKPGLDLNLGYFTDDDVDLVMPELVGRFQAGKQLSWLAGVGQRTVSLTEPGNLNQRISDDSRSRFLLAGDWLDDGTRLGAGYRQYREGDRSQWRADLRFDQPVWTDLTLLSIGLTLGEDDLDSVPGIATVADPDPAATTEQSRQAEYRFMLSQTLAENWVARLFVQEISQEGYLGMPAQQVRYRDLSFATGYAEQPEVVPESRNLRVTGLEMRMGRRSGGALHVQLTERDDSWGADAWMLDLGYRQPLGAGRWEIALGARHYRQDHARFFRDLYDFIDQNDLRTRDRALSEHHATAADLSVVYRFSLPGWGYLERGRVATGYSYTRYGYAEYRDLNQNQGTAGSEPLLERQSHQAHLRVGLDF